VEASSFHHLRDPCRRWCGFLFSSLGPGANWQLPGALGGVGPCTCCHYISNPKVFLFPSPVISLTLTAVVSANRELRVRIDFMEYSSHDTAADTGGQKVNEEEHSPMFRIAIHGARNTHQANQSKTPALQSSFHSRAFPDAPSYKNATLRVQHTPAPTAQCRDGRRAAMAVNAPKTQYGDARIS